jgi:hypothetical protein
MRLSLRTDYEDDDFGKRDSVSGFRIALSWEPVIRGSNLFQAVEKLSAFVRNRNRKFVCMVICLQFCSREAVC